MAKNFENISRLVTGELNITQDQKKSYKITMTDEALKFLNLSGTTDNFVINKDGSFTLPTTLSSSPSSPASGGVVYVKSDGKLYFKNSSGTEYNITDTGEAGDITSVVAGTGLSGGATSGAATLNLDTSNSRNADHGSISITAGTGLSGGGTIASTRTLTLDINGLSALGTTAASGDFIPIYDTDAGSIKKVLVSNLPSSGGGASLSNGSNNRVVTAAGASSLNGEANLTFDGNTLTLTKGSNTASSIVIDGDNEDIDIIRVKQNGNSSYAWAMKYLGAGVGDLNRFALVMDNQAGTDINAILVDQDGDVELGGDLNVANNSYLSGSLTLAGALSLGGTTITANATELNYVDGVTSAIQTQLDAKHATINSGNRLSATLVGANGNISNTEYGYLNGVSSNIQTQLDAKAPTASPTFTGNATFDTDTLFVDSSNNKVGIGTTSPHAHLSIEGDHDGGVVSLRMGGDNSSAGDFSARFEMTEDTNGSQVMTHGAFFEYDGDAADPDFGELKIGVRDGSTSDVNVFTMSRNSPANSLILGITNVSSSIPFSASMIHTKNSYLDELGNISGSGDLHIATDITASVGGLFGRSVPYGYGLVEIVQQDYTSGFGLAVTNPDGGRSIRLWNDSSDNARLDSGANGATPLKINAGGGATHFGGSVSISGAYAHISSGTSGDASLILEADTDNNNENDLPFIEFRQDGGEAWSSITTSSNAFKISNSVSSGGGLILATGTTNGHANATNRLTITPAGLVGIGETPSTYALEVNGDVEATNFRGALVGNASTATSATSATSATNATNATNVTTATDSGNATHYLTFVDSTAATQQLKTDTGISYNPNTNRVGINETSPAAALHVDRNATVGDIGSITLGNATVKITDSATNMYIDGNSINTDANTYVNVSANYDLYFGTNNVERMRIKNTGLIGIGTSSPNAGLHIDVANEPQLLLDGGDNSHGDIVVPTDEILQIGHWDDAGDTYTDRLRIKADGVVAVAGELEAASLDISGDADIDGTLEADAITVNGTALDTHIAGVTVTNATNATNASKVDVSTTSANSSYRITMADSSGTNYESLYVDSGLLYNPSTNRLTVGDITVSDELFVNDYARIDALRVGTTSTDPGDGNLYVEGDATFDTTTLYVDSSNSRVAIGKASTSYGQLEVYKNSSTSAANITIHQDHSSGDSQLHLRSDANDWYFRNDGGDNDLYIKNESTDLFKMDNGGNFYALGGNISGSGNFRTGGDFMANNQPGFLARIGTMQSNLTENTAVTVEFDTEDYDIGSNYDTTTYKFTAPYTGRYFFSTFIFTQQLPETQYFYVNLVVGTKKYRLAIFDPNELDGQSEHWGLGGSMVVKANATEECYIEVFKHLDGADATMDIKGGDADESYSWFNGYFMG